MKYLPQTSTGVVLRTDYSDEASWFAICAAIQKAMGGSDLSFLSDPEYAGISLEQVFLLIPPNEDGSYLYLFIADQMTFSDPEHPILVLDLYEDEDNGIERGRTFRAIPATISLIDANLSLANMDFEEFADYADQTGVFRGF